MGRTHAKAMSDYHTISKNVVIKQQRGNYRFHPSNSIAVQPITDPWITPTQYEGEGGPAGDCSPALSQARGVAIAAGFKRPLVCPGDLTPGAPLQMQASLKFN